MIGYNFRMTEIEDAIGIEQLKNLKGLQTPYVKKGCTHSYYVFPLIYSEKKYL